LGTGQKPTIRPPDINRGKTENVAQEGAIGLGIVVEDDDVSAKDHDAAASLELFHHWQSYPGARTGVRGSWGEHFLQIDPLLDHASFAILDMAGITCQ
jgi:hypothetical protein